MIRIRILMITYNRPDYTEQALSRLCETTPKDARITVWDNGSKEDMVRVLKPFERHPLVERIVYNRTNDKLRGPTNWFWQSVGEAQYVSKVDDDGLMPDQWTEKLEQIHRDVPKTGVLGTWRFPEEDFVEELAKKKIMPIGNHQILRNCWVEGSGYLMKREVIDRIGLIGPAESFTTYCIRAAAAGYINGWPYPFLYQEHMDDPRAPHTGVKTEADFLRLQPLSAQTFKTPTMDQWTAKLKQIAGSLQSCSYNPDDYISRRARFLQKAYRLFGKSYMPKAS